MLLIWVFRFDGEVDYKADDAEDSKEANTVDDSIHLILTYLLVSESFTLPI